MPDTSAARMRTPPGRMRRAMACTTAFSTSGCSSKGGTASSSASSATCQCTRMRSPRRTFSMSRYCVSSSSSSRRLTHCRREVSRLRRSSADRPTSMRSARAASWCTSSAIEFSALNRKCGLSWAEIASSRACASCACNSEARRSCACARSKYSSACASPTMIQPSRMLFCRLVGITSCQNDGGVSYQWIHGSSPWMNQDRAKTTASTASIRIEHARRTCPRRIGKRSTTQNRNIASGTQPHMPTRLVRSACGHE